MAESVPEATVDEALRAAHDWFARPARLHSFAHLAGTEFASRHNLATKMLTNPRLSASDLLVWSLAEARVKLPAPDAALAEIRWQWRKVAEAWSVRSGRSDEPSRPHFDRRHPVTNHPNLSESDLWILAEHGGDPSLALHPGFSPAFLEARALALLDGAAILPQYSRLLEQIMGNPKMPRHVLEAAAEGRFTDDRHTDEAADAAWRTLDLIASRGDDIARMYRMEVPWVVEALTVRPDTPPELLDRLADPAHYQGDPTLMHIARRLRRIIHNPSTPGSTLVRLAADPNTSDPARKRARDCLLARCAPALGCGPDCACAPWRRRSA